MQGCPLRADTASLEWALQWQAWGLRGPECPQWVEEMCDTAAQVAAQLEREEEALRRR